MSPVQWRDSNEKPTPQNKIEETLLSNNSLDQNNFHHSQDDTVPRIPKGRPTQVSKFRVFNRRKGNLEDDLRALESKSSSTCDEQPDSLKSQGLDLKARLVNLRISEWVYADFASCPEVERELDPELVCEWEDIVSRRISKIIN